MEYMITSLKGDDRRVISKHNNLDEAMKAGKIAFEMAEKGELISCISGKLDENGNTIGKYMLYKSWF